MAKRSGIIIGAAVAAIVGAAAVHAADAKVDRGKAVYAEQKCKMCHSIADQGNKKGALDGVGDTLKPEEIKEWIVTPKEAAAKHKAVRKPPMKAFATLPAEDVDALVAYMSSLKKK